MLRRRSWTQGLARPSAIALIVLILGVLILPATRADASPVPVNDSADAKSATMRTRVYVGMWSTRLRDLNEGLAANSLIGFAYRGFRGATSINSFGDPAFSVGLQRSFSRPRTGNVAMSLGYRAGLIPSHDRRFFGIGDKLPVVPFVTGLDVRNDALPDPVNDSADAKSAAMRTRVYVGMWSTHLRDLNKGLAANSLIGFAYRGFYGATFINSFGDRALSVGLQRSFSRPRTGDVTMSLGYRAGLITGYDERFFGVGDKLPVVPFVQFVAGMDVRNAGIELGYAGVVASIMTSWRF